MLDEKAFAKAVEAIVDFRSNNGTHWSLEALQVFTEAYESARTIPAPAPADQRGEISDVDKAVAHLATIGGSKTDWMWCYENPKEAAALIDRLNSAISPTVREYSKPEWQPIKTAPQETPILVHDHGMICLSWQGNGMWSHSWKSPSHWMPLPPVPNDVEVEESK